MPPSYRRDFAILWTGAAVSELGSSMSMLVFPLLGYAITHSPARAGLATTAVLVGRAAMRLPAGTVVDRRSRRNVLILANLGGAAAYAIAAGLAFGHSLTLVGLIAIGLVTGVGDAFVGPALSAAIRTVVPRADLPKALTRMQARGHTAALIGPPLGGALYAASRGLPFLLDALSYAAAAAAVLALHTLLPAPERAEAPASLRADTAEGLRFVWSHVVIRMTVIWGGLINFSMTFVIIAVTLRLVRAGVHPAAIGAVDAIAAAAAILGSLVATVIVTRMRTGVTAILTELMLAAVVVPIAWTTNVVIIGALLAVGFFLLPANNAGLGGYQAAVTPNHLQGRVNAAGGLIANGIEPFAPALAGAVLGAFGGRDAILLGAVFVAASVIPLLASRSIRTLGTPAQWGAELDASRA